MGEPQARDVWAVVEAAVEWGRLYERHRSGKTFNERMGALGARREATAALERALERVLPQDPAR